MARRLRSVSIMASLFVALGLGAAQAGEVYCYAEGPNDTTYVTPVFASDDPPELLAALYTQSLPDAGLSTCVTEAEEKDIAKAWQGFIDNLKAQHYPVVIQTLPSG